MTGVYCAYFLTTILILQFPILTHSNLPLPSSLSPSALSNTISFLRRAGRLEEVPVILAAAEEKDRRSGSHAGERERQRDRPPLPLLCIYPRASPPHTSNHSPSTAFTPGLHFCHGLHARFTNDIGKAIQEFNLCRKDEVRTVVRVPCSTVHCDIM